jgi:hypothetical protein
MAKILILDEKHYISGRVPLRRGDQWVLDGKIVDRVKGYDTAVNLTGASVTAFFPADDDADTDSLIAVSGTLTNAECGQVRITVAEDVTPTVALAEQGISPYAVYDTPSDGPFTVEVQSPTVEVLDRGFNQF